MFQPGRYWGGGGVENVDVHNLHQRKSWFARIIFRAQKFFIKEQGVCLSNICFDCKLTNFPRTCCVVK